MLKRIFILILALCCAFSFVCQPAAAAATGVILTATQIGMAIAGAYGLVLASDAAYGALGTLMHDSVVAVPGSAGTEWWNDCQSGKIRFQNIEAGVQKAVNAVLAKSADALLEIREDLYTYTISTASYTVLADGSVSNLWNFSGRSYNVTSVYPAPIYCVEGVVHSSTSSSKGGSYFCLFFSSEPFTLHYNSSYSDESKRKTYNGITCYTVSNDSSYDFHSIDDYRFRKNCTLFNSVNDVYSYISSLCSISSDVSSSGGATAAYPTYGYDGVSLPDMDLTQPGLVGADGTSTVSDLIAQLQSGAITWEDYIGTVAPGQTATITLTDAEGGSITYKLTNTGVGEAIGTGTGSGSETDETQPIPVVPPGTGTETDVGSKIDGLGASMAEFFQSVKEYFTSVLEKIQAIYDSVVAWLTAVRDAIVSLGAQIVDAIKTWLQWLVEQILAGLQALGQTITNAFADAIAAVQAIPAEIAKAFSAAKPADGVNHFALDLSKYFPFCIPFDLYDFFMCLNAAPEAPVIDWEIPLPGGEMYPMKIDLSVFDPVALLLRRLELLLFCVGLAFKTRDLIKG